jgi:hypothetical protein
MIDGTGLHPNRVRRRVVRILLLLISLPQASIHAQALGEVGSLKVSATLGAMKEPSRKDGGWAFPLTVRPRIDLFQFFHLEFAWIHVFTHRDEIVGCYEGPCPKPDAVWGTLDILTFGGGFSRDFGIWKPYMGIGRGRGWETQPQDLEEFDGPIWAWYGGIERKLGDRVAVLAEYRGIRQGWEHDYETIPKNIHLQHHQLGVGLTCLLF